MTDEEALEYAIAALAHWGGGAKPRLIKNRENAVFETVLPCGTRAALRLHRPGYQSNNAIRSELWWAEALVEAGMDVPLPVRTIGGDVLAEVPDAGRVASILCWMAGQPMGEGDQPLPGTAAEQVLLHERLGAELARLHDASDAANLPEAFERPVLDAEALLGDAPLWGRFWDNPTLDIGERELLQAARSKLAALLADHIAAGGDFGLIHADALRENVLVDRDHLRLIDFDDGVFGFRMYELGVAMSQNWDQANRDALGKALLSGYKVVRPLPQDAEALLEPFTVLRGLASCGWVIGRYAPGDPTVRAYAERAITLCRRWLGH